MRHICALGALWICACHSSSQPPPAQPVTAPDKLASSEPVTCPTAEKPIDLNDVDVLVGSRAGELSDGDIVSFSDSTFVWSDEYCGLHWQGESLGASLANGQQTLIVTGDNDGTLSSLSPEEVARLAGYAIQNGTPSAQLRYLDPSRLCVTVNDEDHLDSFPDEIFEANCVVLDSVGPGVLDRFPLAQHVFLGDNTSDQDEAIARLLDRAASLRSLSVIDATKLQRLAKFRSLVSLSVAGSSDAPTNLDFLSGMSKLRSLRIDLGPLVNLGALSGLTELEELTLEYVEKGEPLERLTTLTRLRRLRIRGRLDDLSFLGALPSLEEVNASFTAATKLPATAMPSLKELHILSTPLAEKEIDRFTALNPQALISATYHDVLRRKLEHADEIHVVWQSLCKTTTPRRIFIKDAYSVRELLALMTVRSPSVPYVIGCYGDVEFRFLAKGRRIGEFSYFDGIGSIRFDDWPSYSSLTPESRAAFEGWMRRHNAD
jgi:hypothetical protein